MRKRLGETLSGLTLERRLVLTSLGIGMALAAFTLVFVPWELRRVAGGGLEQKGEALAELLARTSAPSVEFGDLSSLQQLLTGVAEDPDFAAALVRDAEGGVLTAVPETLTADSIGAGVSRGLLVVEKSIEGAGRQVGSLALMLSSDRSRATQREVVLILVGVTFGLALLGWWITRRQARRIGRAIADVVRVAREMADGNLNPLMSTSQATARDEIALLTDALGRTLAGMREALECERVDWSEVGAQRLATERHQAELSLRADREREQHETLQSEVTRVLEVVHAAVAGDLTRPLPPLTEPTVARLGQALGDLLADLRQRIGAINGQVAALAGAATEMAEVAESLDLEAREARRQVGEAAEVVTGVDTAVTTVSGSVENLTASLQQVATHAVEASTVGQSAIQALEEADETMRRLSRSSGEIGDVVRTITEIASQTNLLALNATIEAARAGDAGKGFAVVANEVKDLARGTARATDEIGGKIATLQSDSGDSVQSIARIDEVIRRINDIQSGITDSAGRQRGTAGAIGAQVVDVAQGSSRIKAIMDRVATGAERTTAGAARTFQASRALTGHADELGMLVAHFQVGTSGADRTREDPSPEPRSPRHRRSAPVPVPG